MANPASTTDLESRWRPLTGQEVTNAETFLDDAWAMLLGRRPTLEADIAAGTVTTANVVRVIAAMVLRVMKNPEGYDTETIDDYTYRRNAIISTGALHVTSDELADITPGRKRRSSVRLVIYGE